MLKEGIGKCKRGRKGVKRKEGKGNWKERSVLERRKREGEKGIRKGGRRKVEREDRWGKESGRGRRKEKICNEEKFFFWNWVK